jgi:YHS domain-containing protein/multidrug efflux pump subunit AcrA (membrane-fusion protein)
MRKIATISLLALSLAGMFLAGTWTSRLAVEDAGTTAGGKVLYYVDPMNPSHTSDKPGPAPCGMAMEPVYAEEGMTGEDSLIPGTARISSQKQQLLGVRVSPVEQTSHTHALRTVARVAPDETRVHRLIAGAPGFISDLSEVTTDDTVKKDQWLASFSSPDSIPSLQAYILGLNAIDGMRQNNSERSAETLEGGATFLLRSEKLQDLGMSRLQMEELRKTRTVPQKIRILSPIDGYVLARNVSPDQRFDRGEEWYRIADLSRVWIVAELFEREVSYIKPGMVAKVSIPHRGDVFDATVTRASPRFDSASRTLHVRLEMDNPGNLLRPDMLVDVEFHINLPPAITVSADAVLDSGTRKTVFVDLGNGHFEPRAVETGWRFGDQVEIVSGLMVGERIVTSGNFLVDSESRMKLAAAGFYGEVALDPVCRTHVEVDEASMEGLRREHNGKSYYFCSDFCRTEFDKDPAGSVARAARLEVLRQERIARKSGAVQGPGGSGRGIGGADDPARHPPAGSDEPKTNPGATEEQTMQGCVLDPVCGMPMPEPWAKAKGLTAEHNGKTYFFCSKECKRNFEKNPEGCLTRRQEEVQRMGTLPENEGSRP